MTDQLQQSGRPVITIWESAGSGMDEVARRVGELLDLPVYGQAISSAELAAAFEAPDDEDDFARLLHGFGSETGIDATLSEADLASLQSWTEQNTRAVLKQARDGGVLLGRNGAYVLREWPGALHVWLDAPEPARVRRASEQSEAAEELEALRLRLEEDVRANLSVFSYGYDPRDLEYYDLVVNTCRLGVEAAAQLIAAAARVPRGVGPTD